MEQGIKEEIEGVLSKPVDGFTLEYKQRRYND